MTALYTDLKDQLVLVTGGGVSATPALRDAILTCGNGGIVSVVGVQAGRGWLKLVVFHNPPLEVRT